MACSGADRFLQRAISNIGRMINKSVRFTKGLEAETGQLSAGYAASCVLPTRATARYKELYMSVAAVQGVRAELVPRRQ